MSLDERLVAAAGAPDARVAVTSVLRESFAIDRARVARRLEGGVDGAEAARLYAAVADAMLASLWRVATEILHPSPQDRLSLLAVGGYGRGVLAPFSDLDLLFLRDVQAISPRATTVIEFIHYVLWDLGLKVGSASRSVGETLDLARSDMTVRTSLLEGRVLAGDADLGEGLLTRFRAEVAKADPRPFIAAKMEERDVRLQKTGAVRYRVEPNVKDGKGGLRDLNTLFWIARSLAPDSERGQAALEGLLSARELRSFREAIGFLWNVRIHLHLAAGRAEEKLTFDFQPEIARRMGWRGRGDELAVERFMRRYFQVAREVGALTRAVSAQLEARQQKKAQGLTRGLSRLIPRRRVKLAFDGLAIEGGRLTVTGGGVFAHDPVRLLLLFVEADRLDLDLHPDAFAAVIRALPLVTPALRRDPRGAEAFLTVLAHGHRPYRVLSIMNETGLLGRFLPEWGRIVGQTQFNMYHAYTVDEHTLQAVGIINDIARGKLKADHPASTVIIHRIADIEVLMLAMLLHDVGKGGDRGQLEDGAIAARRACERLGVDPRRIELVVWLVRQHLALSDYAQKRDVSDPETVRAFAELVGDPERLRLLLVLTVADIRAVGPGVWNSWKGQLMRDLYNRVEGLFRGEDVCGADPLADHQALVARAREAGAAAEAVGGTQTTEIALAARDRPGLFADLAAVMAAAGADITGARVATAEDGTALDLFQVQDGAGAPYGQAEPRRLTTLVAALERVAGGSAKAPPLSPAAISPRRAAFDVRPVVMIDAGASESATLIEVSGADRPGLLAELARALTDHGVSIRSAHVAGFGARAVDSFYVTDQTGGRIHWDRTLDDIQSALEAVVEQAPAQPGGRTIVRARASARDVSELGRRRGRPREPVSPKAEAG